MIFENLMESYEEEVERLRASGMSELAKKPVNITDPSLHGLIIELELRNGEAITVVPLERAGHTVTENKLPDGRYKRNYGYYDVVVVKSSMISYPVGGYDLSMWEAELRRGKRIEL